MSAQKILIGTLTGLLAGVAIGLLTAPAKGTETRQRIADTAEDLKRKLRVLRGQASEELDELKGVFQNEIQGLKDDVREKVLTLIEANRSYFNNTKEDSNAF